MKKTKIVATMSDFRCTEEFVKQLFDAGMDVVRVNSAHVSEDGATHIVETVHRVNPAIPIDRYQRTRNPRHDDRRRIRQQHQFPPGGPGGRARFGRLGLHDPQGGLHERAVDRERHSRRGADADRRRRAGNPRRGQERYGAGLRVRRGRRHAFAQERQRAGRVDRPAVGDRKGPPLHRMGREERR